MTVRMLTLAAVAAIAASPSGVALAQSTADPIPPADGGPIDPFGSLGRQQFEITAGTEDDTASLALELGRWRIQPSRAGGGNAARRGTDTLNLILSAPLNGGEEAAPATLDGLADGTRIALRWGRRIGYIPLEVPARAEAIYERAQAECRRAADAQNAQHIEELGPSPSSAAREAVDVIHRAALAECEDPIGGSQNLIAEHLPREERRYIAEFLPADARQFGFEVAVSRSRFEFVDAQTLAEGSERHVEWSASAFYNQYLRRSKTAFTVSATYQRAYEAADEEIFCPAATALPVRCVQARGAPPERDNNLLLSAGLRHQFMSDGRLLNVAVAPLVTYDALDDVWGVDLPIYFVPNSDGGLTGGVRFGYRSDRENEFSVGIFIGAAFNILN